MKLFFYQTEYLGKIGLAEQDGVLKFLFFEGEGVQDNAAEIQETPLLKEAFRQLQAYFNGRLRNFDLPLSPDGTDFMKKVWTALCTVPYGKTASYKDIACLVGNPKACRAVGMANNRNPLPVFIPCHRIVGANGDLVGYGGGLDIKKKLLKLEQD